MMQKFMLHLTKMHSKRGWQVNQSQRRRFCRLVIRIQVKIIDLRLLMMNLRRNWTSTIMIKNKILHKLRMLTSIT